MFKQLSRYKAYRSIMFRKRTLFLYLLLIYVLSLSQQACNIINPHETIPTYIHIDSIGVAGGFTHDINCVWAYLDDNPIGAFDLPANIPVKINGSSGKITLFAGIRMNGQNNTLSQYPFYAQDTFILNAQPSKVIVHNPIVPYYPNAHMDTLDNFTYTSNFSCYGGTAISVVRTQVDSPAFLNGWVGVITPAVADSAIDSCSVSYELTAGYDGYIEIDYYATVPFYLGLQAHLSKLISSAPYYIVGVSPNTTGKWQKLYFNVGDFAKYFQADNYTLVIKASLPDGQTSGKVMVDNIRFLKF